MNYKELADALQQPGPGTEAFYRACDEAAAILRRLDAAQASVEGVMDQARRYGEALIHDDCHPMGMDQSTTEYRQLRTAIEALALGGWQPIETAPKDQSQRYAMELTAEAGSSYPGSPAAR